MRLCFSCAVRNPTVPVPDKTGKVATTLRSPAVLSRHPPRRSYRQMLLYDVKQRASCQYIRCGCRCGIRIHASFPKRCSLSTHALRFSSSCAMAGCYPYSPSAQQKGWERNSHPANSLTHQYAPTAPVPAPYPPYPGTSKKNRTKMIKNTTAQRV